MAAPNDVSSPSGMRGASRGDHRSIPRSRRRSPSPESDRKRHRVDSGSPGGVPRSRSYHDRPGWERSGYDDLRVGGSYHRSTTHGSHYRSYDRHRGPPRGAGNYPHSGGHVGGNGAMPMYQPRATMQQTKPQHQTSRKRRLYIGNIPFQAGLTDFALAQFFSALYIAGFRANLPGEPLPVLSFWLHGDGKFGFMELRGEQEAVNMMEFNGVALHGRKLKVNRPSDYRRVSPEQEEKEQETLIHNPINIPAVVDLCEKLGDVVAPPDKFADIAAQQTVRAPEPQVPPAAAVASSPHASEKQEPVSSPLLRSQAQVQPQEAALAPNAGSAGSDPKSQEPTPSRERRIISLRNLVTNEDLNGDAEDFEELLEDVEAECGNYGSVQSVNIPKDGPWKGTAFVEYADPGVVDRAVKELSRKVFDGRQIEAVVIDGCQTAAEAASRPKRS